MLKVSHVRQGAVTLAGIVGEWLILWYFGNATAAWSLLILCFVLVVLLDDSVRARTQRWSEELLRKGAKQPMFYFWIFFGIGAVLWGTIFGGTWFYEMRAHKKNPPPFPPSPSAVSKPPTASEIAEEVAKRIPIPAQPAKSYEGFREKLPETVYFSLGGTTALISTNDLRKGKVAPFNMGGFKPIRVHLKGDVLYCDLTLWGGGNNPPVEITDNEVIVRPDWDRNLTANAFEVINEQGIPILQVIRKTSSHWIVNGIFESPSGIIVATEEGTGMGSYQKDPKLRAAQMEKILEAIRKLKPIFKYPSNRYPGEYAGTALGPVVAKKPESRQGTVSVPTPHKELPTPSVSAPGGIAIGRDNLGTAIVTNPPVNPYAPVFTYDFNGARRTRTPQGTSVETGEEWDDFQKMKELHDRRDWVALLTLAEERIKKTPEWLTPYLFAGIALANTGRHTDAIRQLEHVVAKSGGAEEYKDAARILQGLRRLQD